ncbi:MAG: signal peptidase [Clostridia bacterium]|jgi:signal peptidase|nr:signal peptidase [Clostridia bacterium]
MMRKLLAILFNVTMVLIILVSLSYIISAEQVRDNPLHIPSVLGFTPLTVVSGSMSPGIETGDMVIIRMGNKNIKPGDVVTYRLEDVLVTHRIKSISNAADVAAVFITQGDANSIPDYKLVERNQILGKYVFKIPMGGYIRASLRGLPGMLIVMGLIFISIMAEVLNRVMIRANKMQYHVNQ